MAKSNESYPKAIPVGEEPDTGVEINVRSVKNRRGLGKFSLLDRTKVVSEAPRMVSLEAVAQERKVNELRRMAYSNTDKQLAYLDYLASENIYSYSKSLPRRSEDTARKEDGFDGDYDELAISTLERVLTTGQREDGTFNVLSREALDARVAELIAGTPTQVGLTRSAAYEMVADDRTYSDGVPTLLWKLGVMQYEDDRSFLYGGKDENFNHDATWTGNRNMKQISLPFDSQNPLHQRIAEAAGHTVTSIDLTLQRSEGGSYHDMSLHANEAHELEAAA